MRLIDADKLLNDYEELADCDFIHPLYENTLRDIIDDAPTVEPCEDCISRAEAIRIAESYYHTEQVVEEIRELSSVTPKTDVLDKIRAEIIQMPNISSNANDIYKVDVLAIIDKYKAESEK